MYVESNPKAVDSSQINKRTVDLIIYSNLLIDFHLLFNLGANHSAVILPSEMFH